MKFLFLILLFSLTLIGCASSDKLSLEGELDKMDKYLSRLESIKAQEKKERYNNREYLYCDDYGCGINKVDGTVVVPAKYKILEPLLNNKSRGYLAFVYGETDRKVGLMNYDYEKITPAVFNSGKIPPVIQDYGYLSFGEMVNGNQKKGILSVNGLVFIPKFENIRHVHDGIFSYLMQKNGKWGLINKDGHIMIDEKLDEAAYSREHPSGDGKVFILKIAGNSHIVNESGKWILSPKDAEIEQFSRGKVVFSRDSKYGLMALNGDIVFDAVYDKIFIHGRNGKYAGFSSGDEKSCYNLDTGNVELSGNYESLECPTSNFTGNAKVNGSVFLINDDFSINYEKGYDYILPYNMEDEEMDGYLSVSRNGKSGIINSMGRVIIPLKYEWIEGFDPEQNVALVGEYHNNQNTYYIVSSTGRNIDSIRGRSYVKEVGDNIYAFYNGNWISAGMMRDVIYYDLKQKVIIDPPSRH